MSRTTSSGRTPRSHARDRARPRPSRIAWSLSSPMESMTRHAVESDATPPNRSGWSLRAPRSHNASPPSASITAKSRRTTPGSCPARRERVDAIAPDNASVRPTLSAKPRQQSAAGPRHHRRVIRNDMYLLLALRTRHLQGDPPGRGAVEFSTHILPAQPDVPASAQP